MELGVVELLLVLLPSGYVIEVMITSSSVSVEFLLSDCRTMSLPVLDWPFVVDALSWLAEGTCPGFIVVLIAIILPDSSCMYMPLCDLRTMTRSPAFKTMSSLSAELVGITTSENNNVKVSLDFNCILKGEIYLKVASFLEQTYPAVAILQRESMLWV